MNPDGGAAPETFETPALTAKIALGAGRRRCQPRSHLKKWAENPIPPNAVASSKISSRILGYDNTSIGY